VAAIVGETSAELFGIRKDKQEWEDTLRSEKIIKMNSLNQEN